MRGVIKNTGIRRRAYGVRQLVGFRCPVSGFSAGGRRSLKVGAAGLIEDNAFLPPE